MNRGQLNFNTSSHVVIIKSKTIFSLYVLVICSVIQIILYVLAKSGVWDSRAKYQEGWYTSH